MTVHRTQWATSPRPSWPETSQPLEARVFAAKHVSPVVEAELGKRMAAYAKRENARCGISFSGASGRSAKAAREFAEFEARILAIVSETPGATYRDIRAETNRGWSRIKDTLSRMAGAGQLRRERHRSSGAVMFYLPEESQ